MVSAPTRLGGCCRTGPIVFIVALGATAHGAGEPAYSFRNPFHPYQCEEALAFGRRQLQRDPSNARARLIVAEGYLCLGLEGDPWALDTSIDLLQQIIAERPDNWFARVELADAIRKRFPLSEAALTALKELRTALPTAPIVDRERAALTEYFDENAAALEENRARLLPLVRELADTALSSARAAERAGILVQCGDDGARAALQQIEAVLLHEADNGLLAFYRAEAQVGRVSPTRAHELFRAAAHELCEATPENADCWRPRLRLQQLARFTDGQEEPERATDGLHVRRRRIR